MHQTLTVQGVSRAVAYVEKEAGAVNKLGGAKGLLNSKQIKNFIIHDLLILSA